MSCNKQSIISLIIVFFSTFIFHISLKAELSSLAKNDALPVFSTLDPHHYLQTAEKLKYKDVEWAEKKGDRVSVSISPFGQNADRGKTIRGEDTFIEGEPVIGPSLPTGMNQIIELGDLTGRSGMIPLLFGQFPQGQTTFPGGENGALQTAANELFPGQMPGTINDPSTIDTMQRFGYFSFPLDYRKRGIALEFAYRFYKDFGFRVQTRVSTIRQVVRNRINLTDSEGTPDMFGGITDTQVNEFLMVPLDCIAREIGLNICDYCETSIEEIRFNLFWRHAFEINPEEDEYEWPYFLFIPFIELTGSVSPGQKKDPNKLFALPHGNNDHHAVGFTAGLNIDFLETIEIGGEVGFTHFFDRSFKKFRVPNSKFQTTIFPFTTDVEISPGKNWHFGAKLSAYHFLDKLSVYFEWFVIEHKPDTIKLKKTDPAFMPEILEKLSTFKTKLANIGFNYDLSPNIGLGFLWQTPFSQRNTYRSTLIMFGFNATF